WPRTHGPRPRAHVPLHDRSGAVAYSQLETPLRADVDPLAKTRDVGLVGQVPYRTGEFELVAELVGKGQVHGVVARYQAAPGAGRVRGEVDAVQTVAELFIDVVEKQCRLQGAGAVSQGKVRHPLRCVGQAVAIQRDAG